MTFRTFKLAPPRVDGKGTARCCPHRGGLGGIGLCCKIWHVCGKSHGLHCAGLPYRNELKRYSWHICSDSYTEFHGYSGLGSLEQPRGNWHRLRASFAQQGSRVSN
jgi:hypothetical protein